MNLIHKTAVALAAGLLALGAHASTNVTASELIAAGALGKTNQSVEGFTFASTGGSFQSKTIDGITGVGVSGGTSGEIDVGQAIVASFNGVFNVTSIDLAFLFNGPEYNDRNEIAKISLMGTNLSATLIATGDTTASWSFSGGTISNLSPATSTGAGAWDILNPFGSAIGTGLKFEAINNHNKANNSDYAFLGVDTVAAVPEPSTYALLIAGLMAVGSVVRRRSRQA